MGNLYLAKIAVSIRVKLPEEVLERHLPASPYTLGSEIASQVQDFARVKKLGYYPALEYLQTQGGVESYLLDAMEEIAGLAIALSREEVRLRLREAFSSLQIKSIQSLAFTMPNVRPNQPDAFNKLVEHFTPDKLKLDLVVSIFQRKEPDESVQLLSRHMLLRWLKESFENVEITSARLLS
jgi:hypothetical protein